MVEIAHSVTRKAVCNLRSRLLGAATENKDWYLVVEALEYCLEKHDGMFRKDKVTPYALHPVQVTQYMLTLPNLILRTQALAAALLHDVMEDCDVRYQELSDIFRPVVADGVEVLSKKVDGIAKSEDHYFRGLATSCIGSIGKPCDRVNNQLTLEVFTPEKALATVDFTERRILPMMKEARRRFAAQELAYENAKLVLQSQIRQTRHRLQGLEPEAAA